MAEVTDIQGSLDEQGTTDNPGHVDSTEESLDAVDAPAEGQTSREDNLPTKDPSDQISTPKASRRKTRATPPSTPKSTDYTVLAESDLPDELKALCYRIGNYHTLSKEVKSALDKCAIRVPAGRRRPVEVHHIFPKSRVVGVVGGRHEVRMLVEEMGGYRPIDPDKELPCIALPYEAHNETDSYAGSARRLGVKTPRVMIREYFADVERVAGARGALTTELKDALRAAENDLLARSETWFCRFWDVESLPAALP